MAIVSSVKDPENCTIERLIFMAKDDRTIHYYGPQDLEILETIGSGGFASVYLTNIANGHKHIIQFYGLTKLQDEKKYSLVLEYAEGGTLRDYLRNDTISFEWKDQLRFAEETASAILWLHDGGIIHGDLVKCCEHDPDKRPDIHTIISELNLINPENNNVSTTITPKESEENGRTENLYLPD
ncbi:kinase-like domain-containing protein [Rhizophagus diaphanus]|nr:kinase-like domain-containing protein [Rhizophagus diaphanus] [Rhizophagus sp. MUCL 43196]